MSKEFNILKQICHIPSPSNYEDNLIAYIESYRDELKNFECKKTKKKSCFFYNKKSLKNKKTIMIDAHIDNVHLRIVNINNVDNTGYVIARAIGFKPYILHGNSVIHLKTKFKGTIVTPPPHLNIIPDINEELICIDFGMTKEELDSYMSAGDPIIFNIEWYSMNNKYIVSTGLDNKVSVYVLLELLKWFNSNINKLGVNVYINFSSREEVGLGSYSPLINKNIDEVIVLDSDIATDNEYIPENLIGKIYLDKGVVISHNVDDDTELSKKFKEICKKNNLDYQENYSSAFGGSNLTFYSKLMDSYTQFIGIPIRNMHSPTEIVSMKDLKTCIELMKLYLMR
jgi:putative aminopeptidase FrvX